MLELTLKTYLGIFLFLCSSAGLFANFLVVVPVFRLAFSHDKSTIYVISAVNILNDIVHLLISTFYLAPTIITSSFWFSEERNGRVTVFISTIFLACWYIGNIIEMVMAFNRWTVICLGNATFFTKRKLSIVFFFTLFFGISKSYIVQYVLPCCEFLIDHTVLSYSYFELENVPNYNNKSDVPLNAFSSTVSVLCYVLIYYKIRSTSQSVNPCLQNRLQKQRGRQELSYAMQFCLISVFYTSSWIIFRIFPLIFGGRQIEWFILTSLCHVANCTANAFVYIVFNREIKRQLALRKLFYLPRRVILEDTSEHRTSRIPTIVMNLETH